MLQLVLLILCASGCVRYYPRPLPESISLIDCLSTEQMGLEEISSLALSNNPDLVLARDDIGLAKAEIYAASLLPDPTLAASQDFPFPGVDAVIAYMVGINYDLQSLVLLPGNYIAAQLNGRKVYLDLLWKEQQTISQAGIFYARIVLKERQLKSLHEHAQVIQKQFERVKEAWDLGVISFETLTAQSIVMQDVQSRFNALAVEIDASRKDLNALLGLCPNIHLALQDLEEMLPLNTCEIVDLIPELLPIRADLIALRAGYQAGERRLWQAVLAQFPSFILGPTRARDNTDVNSWGYTLGVTLPIFNANRGNIAIETATRQRLYDEYQTRLNNGYSDIVKLLSQDALLMKSLASIDENLEQLRPAAKNAEEAFRQGLIDAALYVDLYHTMINQYAERLNILLTIVEGRISLQTLLGLPLFWKDAELCES